MNSKVCLTELQSIDRHKIMTIIILHIYKKQKQHKKHILESAANITSTCKLYLVVIFILLNWKSIVNYRWMNSSWFHCMFSSLYPELCYAGHLKYLSVKLKFIIYCRSCGQQNNDHVMIWTFWHWMLNILPKTVSIPPSRVTSEIMIASNWI